MRRSDLKVVTMFGKDEYQDVEWTIDENVLVVSLEDGETHCYLLSQVVVYSFKRDY